MKTIYFFNYPTAALVRADSSESESSEEVLQRIKSKYFKEYLKENRLLEAGSQKFKQICPGQEEKLRQSLVELQKCDDSVDNSLTICESIQTSVLNCTKPLLDVLDSCLPAKAKGLPTLGVQSLVSVSNYLCKLNGESIFGKLAK